MAQAPCHRWRNLLTDLILSVYIKKNLGGACSLLDKEFYYWSGSGRIEAIFTVHVDDILAIATQEWLDWAREAEETLWSDQAL